MEIPTYYPTLQECENLRQFCDFKQYETPLGICKIKLPPELNIHSLPYEVLAQLRCKRPTHQTHLHHKGEGWFRLGLRSQKTRSVAEVLATSRPAVENHAQFWATFGQYHPLYGNDCEGTAFSRDSPHLNTLFPNALQGLCLLKGINTPFLYVATAGSAFAYHVEDLDCYSANYMHWGAPKVWYTFARTDNAKFEALLRKHYPVEARACPEFIRHKIFLPAPHILEAAGITVHMIEQHVGELMVTFPQGYHAGYNIGPNIAEAINFITASWVPLGKMAGRCECHANTLHINFEDLTFQADEIYAPQQLYCTCRQEWDGTTPMIQCTTCQQWFHYACVHLALDFNTQLNYHCPTCAPHNFCNT